MFHRLGDEERAQGEQTGVDQLQVILILLISAEQIVKAQIPYGPYPHYGTSWQNTGDRGGSIYLPTAAKAAVRILG